MWQDEQNIFIVHPQMKLEFLFLINFNNTINIHLFSQKLTWIYLVHVTDPNILPFFYWK